MLGQQMVFQQVGDVIGYYVDVGIDDDGQYDYVGLQEFMCIYGQ